MGQSSSRGRQIEYKNKDKECKQETLYKFVNTKKGNYLECVICLQDMEEGQELIMLPCSHIYHEKCILSWVERKRKCPLCDINI